jgi:outer membrane lipoprotein SlyB
MTTTSQPQDTPPSTTATALNKTALVIGGLGLMAIGALAAVLWLGNRAPVAGPAPTPQAETAPASAAPTAPPAVTKAEEPVPASPPPAAEPAPAVRAAAVTPPPAPAAVARPAPAPDTTPVAKAEPKPAPRPAPVCASCGVVTAVTPVEKPGEAGALGTVGGAVVGGVLGHQVGGGTGKTLATAAGAVGGALAGREIEKRQRTTTVYDVRVRMDDGSSRSFTLENAVSVGQKVRVDGDRLTLDGTAR